MSKSPVKRKLRQPTKDREKNEGEGNRTAARHYNEAQQRFVKSGEVVGKAHEAEAALDEDEGRELERAEAIGRRHAADEDPAVTRRHGTNER